MELTTHTVFAFAVGLIFFGRLDAALLITLGALVPDLDREYWFVRVRKYQEEQPHRARFHNVFVIAVGYLLSMDITTRKIIKEYTNAFRKVLSNLLLDILKKIPQSSIC